MKRVIDKLNPDRAPDPGEFTSHIFQLCWNEMKADIMVGLMHLVLGRTMVRELNNTFITLIPKIKGVERMEDFRPVSCVKQCTRYMQKFW